MSQTLYYVHDPMCSWCYAFGPVCARLQPSLPDSLQVVQLLGGLAPDNDSPMEAAMREAIEATWRRIETSVPGTHFNFDFWRECTPYRSTYASCRAVIAAGPLDEPMTMAIQHAYYRQARNPSLRSTLIEIAAELGLDSSAFEAALDSEETQVELQRQIALARNIGADSFPSLVLEADGSRWPIAIDYNDPAPMLETIELLLGD